MPVSIKYMGRLGNNIIQYAAARIFAEDNDLILATPWCWPDWLATTNCASGAREVGLDHVGGVTFDDKNYDGTLNCAPPGFPYIFQGYFQNSAWLIPNRERIKDFFSGENATCRYMPPRQHTVNKEDLGIHVRLTDGATLAGLNHIIHPDWYEQILSREAKNFRKIYVFTDDIHAWNMFGVFKKYGAEIRSRTVPEDFHDLMCFENLVMAPSTFSYTAALLGHARRVWMHEPFITIPEVKLDFPGAIKVKGSFINGRCP